MERGFYEIEDGEPDHPAAHPTSEPPKSEQPQRDVAKLVEALDAGKSVAEAMDVAVIREGARPGDVGGAMKLDAGKAPLFNGFINYFPRAMIAVAWVSDYGNRKYGEWGGWRKVADGIFRYFDGNSRHHVMQAIELYDDGDSGLAHAAQDAWNAMAKLELMLSEGKIEARRGNEIVNGKPVLGTARKA